MNYKLEKFWNVSTLVIFPNVDIMNYKLEKFWNRSSINLPAKNL